MHTIHPDFILPLIFLMIF